MPDLTVNVHRFPVRIASLSGRTFDAKIFLHYLSPAGPRPGGLEERLNGRQEDFLPCEIEEHVELLHVTSLAYVQCSLDLPELSHWEELGASHLPARVHLTTGEVLEGNLVSIRPPGRSRLSDLLNDGDRRFLLMRLKDRVVYLNRQAIARVRP